MTKDELIYELTRTFSETPGDTDVFVSFRVSGGMPITAVEVDTIGGKQRIVLS